MDINKLGRLLMAGHQKGHELTTEARAAICGCLVAGKSSRQVAAAFGISPTTALGAPTRFRKSGNFTSNPRLGRPAVLSQRETRSLLRMAKTKPKSTYNELRQGIATRVSRSTVRRTLRAHKIRKWKLPAAS